MKTVTYDETKWRLVPIKATEEILNVVLIETGARHITWAEAAWNSALAIAPEMPE